MESKKFDHFMIVYMYITLSYVFIVIFYQSCTYFEFILSQALLF